MCIDQAILDILLMVLFVPFEEVMHIEIFSRVCFHNIYNKNKYCKRHIETGMEKIKRKKKIQN